MTQATPRTAASFRLTAAIALLAVVACVGLRVLGASDLHQNTDQSKTMAFTADVAFNAELFLPRDGIGERTLKPPLINWLGAPLVRAGWHDELAYKLPCILAGLLTALIVVFAARWLLERFADSSSDAARTIASLAAPLAIATGAAWLASPSAIKHLYFLRPDVLQTMFLTIAWYGATRCLAEPNAKAARPWAAITWLGAGGAALAKGPMALLVPLYIIALALLVHRSVGWLRAINRTHWPIGLPVMLAMPLIWLAPAWNVDPEHVRSSLLGRELMERVERGSSEADPFRMLRAVVRVPGFFLERFAPWAIPAFIAIALWITRRWRPGPLAPALVWIVIVYAMNIVSAGRSGSFVAPAYPATAIIAVYAIARLALMLRPITPTRLAPLVAAIALVAGAGIGAREAFLSRGARTGYGNELAAFADTIRPTIADDQVAFVGIGYAPLPPLLGRHRAGEPDEERLAGAAWIVAPAGSAPIDPIALSGDFNEDGSLRKDIFPLALYRAEDFRSTTTLTPQTPPDND